MKNEAWAIQDESPQETAYDAAIAVKAMLDRKDELEISDTDMTVLAVAGRIMEDYAK